MPFVATWLDLEDMTLNEISQNRERQIPYHFTHMWNLKTKMNKTSRIQPINTENKLMVAREEVVGDGQNI